MSLPFRDRRQLSEGGELNRLAVRGVVTIGLVAIIGTVVLVAYRAGGGNPNDAVAQVLMALVMIASNVVSGLVGFLARDVKHPSGAVSAENVERMSVETPAVSKDPSVTIKE